MDEKNSGWVAEKIKAWDNAGGSRFSPLPACGRGSMAGHARLAEATAAQKCFFQ